MVFSVRQILIEYMDNLIQVIDYMEEQRKIHQDEFSGITIVLPHMEFSDTGLIMLFMEREFDILLKM